VALAFHLPPWVVIPGYSGVMEVFLLLAVSCASAPFSEDKLFSCPEGKGEAVRFASQGMDTETPSREP
jgi:hypothetical protein